MEKRKLIIYSIIVSLLVIGSICSIALKDDVNQENVILNDKKNIKNVDKNNDKQDIVNQEVSVVSIKETNIKKADLYQEYSFLPLSAIAVLSSLPENLKAEVNKLIENNNLYYIKQYSDGIFIISGNSENEKYSRQDLQFINYDFAGNKTASCLGYDVYENIEDNDEWLYDEKSGLPLKHTNYNSDRDINFSEIWNYSQDEPIKYEMKNNEGQVISIRKETTEGESNLRIEHLIYDSDGNTKINVCINYEGADITRFTYYNAEQPDEGVVIMSEYKNGVKIKESLYSSDYKLRNIYNAEYKNGERTNLTILDSSENQIEKLTK